MEGLTGDKLSDGGTLTTKEDIVPLAVVIPGTLETPKMPPSETDKVPTLDKEALQKCATRESIARDHAQTLLSTTSRMPQAFSMLDKQQPLSHIRRRSCLIVPPVLRQLALQQPTTSSSSSLPRHGLIISVELRETGVIFRRVQSPSLPPSLPK